MLDIHKGVQFLATLFNWILRFQHNILTARSTITSIFSNAASVTDSLLLDTFVKNKYWEGLFQQMNWGDNRGVNFLTLFNILACIITNTATCSNCWWYIKEIRRMLNGSDTRVKREKLKRHSSHHSQYYHMHNLQCSFHRQRLITRINRRNPRFKMSHHRMNYKQNNQNDTIYLNENSRPTALSQASFPTQLLLPTAEYKIL